MEPMNIGVVGCGNISGIYFENLTKTFAEICTVYACADLDEERAEKAAKAWGIPRVMTFEEMLTCDEIELIVNLTTPQGHYPLCKRALEAGKHVYVEKPLSLRPEEGQELCRLAAQKGLRIGGAPDTFLGAGISTCRKLIDDGRIGQPIGAAAFMLCHGHESWHPDPAFYYKEGGGPMLDMGPYYLTALVLLMGSVREVCGMCNITFPTRTITSAPKKGEQIAVEVPTHVNGIMRFESGAVATITTSFDVWKSTLPRIEIYGTEGSLLVPDPNSYGGPVLLAKGGGEFEEIPLTHIYEENSRGLGVADMVAGIRQNRDARADGALACHVLEIMRAFEKSDAQKQFISLETTCKQPMAMPTDIQKGQV